MTSQRAVYRENGHLGVLAGLLEEKLIFGDEYGLLLAAVGNGDDDHKVSDVSKVKGANEIMNRLLDGEPGSR